MSEILKAIGEFFKELFSSETTQKVEAVPQPEVSGTLRFGMRNEDVKTLQKALYQKGYFKSIDDVDGIFLAGTEAAVKQFQKENELLVDGIAGAFTLAKLGIAVKQNQNTVTPETNPFKYKDGTLEFYKAAFAFLKYDNGFETRINNVAKNIIKNLDTYQEVVESLGISYDPSDYAEGESCPPAVFIGLLHNMESSLSFAGVLHNGEKIIGTGKKTTLVPKGRGPFRTWAEAAADALALKNIHLIKDWSIPKMLMVGEKFNGWGYVTGAGKAEYSPYVWAQSNINDGLGKYTSDGKFDPNANANGQTGIATALKEVLKLLNNTQEEKEDDTELVGLGALISYNNPNLEKRMVKRAVPFLSEPTVKNKDHFVVINYSLKETFKRLWVIETKTGKVILSEKCALGKNTDKNKDGYADKGGFSNINGSYQSSLGAILVGRKFVNPKWQSVWLLYGLEPKLNGNILKRQIVLHSTKYVDDIEGKAIGETLGCIGVSEAAAKRIEPYIKDAFIYAWAEDLEVA